MATDIRISSPALAPVGEGLRAFSTPSVAGVATPVALRPAIDSATEVAPVQSLDAAVRELSGYVAQSSAELSFRVDEDSGRVVVSVVDARDGTVLRQMPTEEALRIARALADGDPALIQAQA